MTTNKSLKEQADEMYAKLTSKAKASTATKITDEERLKKYFNTVLPDGVQTAEKTIRILPTKDGSNPFIQQKFHEIQLPDEKTGKNKYHKIWDPAQVGEPSPLTDLQKMLYASSKEGDKELAKDYRSKDFIIVKIIERGAEEDGPKFWRFKVSYKNDGIFDKIMPIIRKAANDINDPILGRDLSITLNLTMGNNNKPYTSISTILAEDPSPLSQDQAKVDAWINDETTWDAVYPKKPIEYLQIIAEGEVPYWNKDEKKYVAKSSVDNTTIGGKSEIKVNTEVEETPADPQVDEEPDEDLPF